MEEIVETDHRRGLKLSLAPKHKKRLAAGLRPDPLPKLTALPSHLAGFQGRGRRGGWKGAKGGKGGDMREGEEMEEGKGRREGREYRLESKLSPGAVTLFPIT